MANELNLMGEQLSQDQEAPRVPLKSVFTSREAREITSKNIERLNDINSRFVNKVIV